MNHTCFDDTCVDMYEGICTKYSYTIDSPLCAKSELKTPEKVSGVADNAIKHIETNDEYLKEFTNFKDFVYKLRREINTSDTKEGSWKNITNFAIGMKMVDNLTELVHSIERQDAGAVKNKLIKLSAITYKMWRNL